MRPLRHRRESRRTAQLRGASLNARYICKIRALAIDVDGEAVAGGTLSVSVSLIPPYPLPSVDQPLRTIVGRFGLVAPHQRNGIEDHAKPPTPRPHKS